MTVDQATRDLPHWDLSGIFPALDASAYAEAFDAFTRDVAALRALFDEAEIRRIPDADTATLIDVFDDVVQRLNRVSENARTLYAYASCHVATDASNDLAQGKLSELQRESVELSKLSTRFEAWIGSLDVDLLIECSDVARTHAFPLRKAAESARHQMPEGEEDLAASLHPSGQGAWTKLHGNVTSRLEAHVVSPDGTTQTLPMSAVRGLAYDGDAVVREAAYRAEMDAWPTVEVPLAAALNSIKGAQNTLNGRRGWPDSISPALFANNVDHPTLEAMQQACVASFGDFRRYLQAKARLLGREGALPWWDLFAPVGDSESVWDWPSAERFVVDRFGAYSRRLAGLAEGAFADRWVDAEPRVGKRDGAFCMGMRPGESRVLLNFKPAFGSVSTLAHELGHAYHNLCLAERSPLQRRTPMALAETASIFCQTLVVNAMLGEATGAPNGSGPAGSSGEELSILESELQNACQIVVDIHSRFLFETAVFEGRERRELSVGELNEAMTAAQAQTYGDGIDASTYHPYMWAVKPHYYGSSFYNWPYTFGLLFGLGLYARYEDDPERFRSGYDDLLSSTGLDDAATLAARFGIDVRAPDFWTSSLDVLRARIDRYEELAP